MLFLFYFANQKRIQRKKPNSNSYITESFEKKNQDMNLKKNNFIIESFLSFIQTVTHFGQIFTKSCKSYSPLTNLAISTDDDLFASKHHISCAFQSENSEFIHINHQDFNNVTCNSLLQSERYLYQVKVEHFHCNI